jgi:hypothetical protein
VTTCHLVQIQGAQHFYIACDGTSYLCHPHHRSAAFRGIKSQWAINRARECHVFCQAINMAAKDNDGGLWFVAKDAKRVLGEDGERLAYFVPQQSHTSPWHGYPVGGNRRRARERRPAPSIIGNWTSSGRIPAHVADKLRRGVL